MFANIVSLEVRKQRPVALSILFIAGVTLAVGILQSFVGHTDPILSLMTVIFAGVIALPVVALVLAAAAARGLRGELRRSAEEMLPFSPALRLLGAYTASLTQFLILAALFLIPFSLNFGSAGSLDAIKTVHALFCLWILYVHLLAFAFTYWTAQPVLGGGLAAICAAVTALCTLDYMMLQSYTYPFTGMEQSWKPIFAAIAVGCAAGIGGLWILARPVERSEKLGLKALAAGLALICVPVLTFVAVLRQVHILETTLCPISFSWPIFDPESPLNGAPDEGALFRTASGSVIRVTQDGTKQVLYQAPEISPFTLQPIRVWIIDLVTDQEGTTWLLLQPDLQDGPPTYEIRRGRPGEKLESYTTFVLEKDVPRTWAKIQGRLYLCTTRRGRGLRCAELPERGKVPQWKNIPEFGLPDTAGSGRAAVSSPDRTSLILKQPDGTEKRWQLPGKAARDSVQNYAAHAAPFPFGAYDSLFIVPVFVGERKERLVFCYPDGTVRDPWNRVWDTDTIASHSLSGGTVWRVGSWNDPSALLIVDRSGNTYPPVSIHDLYEQAYIPVPDRKHEFPQIISLRIENDRLWAVLQGTLVEIDLKSGRLSRKLAKLAGPSEWVSGTVFLWPLNEGVYLIKDEHIHLIDWNGTVRDLGKAEIPDAGIF